MNSPRNLIKMNKYTHTLETPVIILKRRNLDVIGEIKHFNNWTTSFQALEKDEISFDVYRELNGEKCDIWDDIIDLAIIEVKGYGHFEISVSIDESNETVKSVVGQSLEVELGQLILHDFYVNDFDEERIVETEYNADDFDKDGNLIPTVFCDFGDTKHSLLHRVLADKAPHWSIGNVPKYIAINKTDKPELSSTFQRTYTVDGTSIYDFLMNDVAKESNVIFIFDTYNRIINCYNAEDYTWVDPDGKEDDIVIDAYGTDTTILVDKDNLANQITISGDKDSVKNCFRISGGDDIITSRVAVVSMTGNNYIWQFSEQQMNDMSKELQSAINSYIDNILENEEIQNQYYGNGLSDNFVNGEFALYITSAYDAYVALNICKNHNVIYADDIEIQSYFSTPYWSVVTNSDGNIELQMSNTSSLTSKMVNEVYDSMGIFTRLCTAYDLYYLFESELMPNVGLTETTAINEYQKVLDGFASLPVGVYSYDNYDDNLFVGITNSVEELACVFLDSRYEIEIIDGSTSYNSSRHEWYGRIKIFRTTDETDYYETPENQVITISVTQGELEFTKQKILKALAKDDITEIDKKYELVIEESDTENDIAIKKAKLETDVYNDFYNNYCRVRLQSFYDAYQTCLSILGDLTAKDDSIVAKELQGKYSVIAIGVGKALNKRENDVEYQYNIINNKDNGLLAEQNDFREKIDFQKYLGEDLYKEYCMYRRDDEYQNDNYISDGLTDSEITAKAKELLEVAKEEIKKACVLQRSMSTDLNNLLIMPEFEPFYDSFGLFNYIRVRTDDELFKLRLLGIKYDSNSPEKIDVTFAENIESVNGNVSDLQSMYDTVTSIATTYGSTIKQAKSGEKANNIVSDFYTNGVNATLMKVTSSDNNEVTFGAYGLLCKEMLDEGIYSPNQVRIINKGIYMTTDNWQSIRACLGETTDENGNVYYGLIADTVVGKLIAGSKLIIQNSENKDSATVVIDGNGITIKDGYLELSNGINTVTINPNDNDKLFKITNSDNGDVFYTDNEGNLNISAKITATSGFLGDTWYIDSYGIYTGSTKSTDGNMLYLCSNSNSKAIICASTKDIDENYNKSVFTSGGIYFYDNETLMSAFYSNRFVGTYTGTSNKGTALNSAPDSKYIAFGNKDSETETSYPSHLILNFGLNPDGYTEDVLIYGASRMLGEIFINGNTYLNGIVGGGIYCSGEFSTEGKLYVGDTDYGHTLNVNGTGYINGDLYCNSQTDGGMVHMIVDNGMHKGALAVNNSSFGLWDFTREEWIICIKTDGSITGSLINYIKTLINEAISNM